MTAIKVSRGNYTDYDTILKTAGQYEVDANVDFNGNDILGLDDISFLDGATLSQSATGVALNIPTGDVFQILVNSVEKVNVSASFIILNAELSMSGFDISSLDDIVFSEVSGGVNQEIRSDTAGIDFRLPTGDIWEYYIGGTLWYILNSTEFNLLGGDVLQVGRITGSTTSNVLDDTTGGWSYQVATGNTHTFVVNGVTEMTVEAGEIDLKNNYLEISENTAPAAGAANTVRIFAQDNGAGKTQLMAIFNTGAAQQIVLQP